MYIFDFDETNIPAWIYSVFWGIYLIVWCIMIYQLSINRSKNSNTAISVLFCLFFTFYAVFYCVNPDYFRYRFWVSGRDFLFWTKESFYVLLISFLRSIPFDYPIELFRFVVWGGAIFLFYYTLTRYERVKPLNGLLFLFVLYNIFFCYARASLGMAVYFTGLCIFSHTQRVVLKVLGILLILSAILFHKELVILIALTPFAFTKLEGKLSLTRVSAYYLIIVLFLFLIQNNIDMFNFSADGDSYSDKINEYNRDVAAGRWSTIRLSHIIGYTVFYYPFFLIMKIIKSMRVIPIPIKYLFRITYGIILTTFAFMLVYGFRNAYVYRTLYMAMIPLSTLLAYFYSQNKLSKTYMYIILILALLSTSAHYIFYV